MILIEGCYFWAIALMMEAVSTSETLVNFYQTTRRYIPEDSHFYSRRREQLKSYMVFIIYEMYTGKDFEGRGDSYFKILSKFS
jgi:hypothetical protein